jgi:ABA sandwich protein
MNTQNKLTRDEILNMPAGREMDILMIDIVGGELIDKAIHYDASMGIRYAIQDDGVWRFQPGLAWLWSPSTDIAAAWEVVKKMPDGFELRLHQHKLIREAWQAEFHEPGTENFMVLAATAPLAICRAALLAVLE